jgi:mannose-6-phosphate isomerase
MLVPLSNDPRDYAWGSATLLAELQGRRPSGRPEAEIWFGDHPADPSVTSDGRTLDAWLEAEGPATGAPARLPYLLKLLAAASALSIQAHPSKAQAEAGFAREEAAGIPRDAAERTYRDDNHKPELLVAISDEFRALAGLRDLDATRRLVSQIGPGAATLAQRLQGDDVSLGAVIGWLLSEGGAADARDIVAAATAAESTEFAAELDMVRALETSSPGDPGIVVALLMNLVTLRRGEGLFIPAGVLHAYLEGLGVELMAASDNVLRGGLTPKHIDVPELLSVLDETPGAPMIVQPQQVEAGADRYDVPVADFALFRVRAGAESALPIDGPAIAVSTGGAVSIAGSTGTVALSPGAAVFATPDEGRVAVRGEGDVFVAVPG